MSTLEKAVSQEHLTLDTVDFQFCSDWLKDEIKRLFAEIDTLRKDAEIQNGGFKALYGAKTEMKHVLKDMILKAEEQRDTYKEALEKIGDPRKRDHQEPDAYTQLGCVMNIANEALEKIANKKEK